jgi:hypothetical protein
MHHGFINLHFLDEPLQNLPLRGIILFNVLVEFLAQRQILGLQLLVGFPPGVRRHPVLNHTGLVARCQVNEFANVLQLVILFPFIVFNVHGFSLHVGAMNRPLVHIHALQIVHDDGAHALNDAVVLRKFQIRHRDVERFHEITEFNGILALLIQKHIQVELRVVRRIDHVVVANSRRHLSDRGHQFLVLVQQLLHHHVLLLLVLVVLPPEMAQHARHHVLQTQTHITIIAVAQVGQSDGYGVIGRPNGQLLYHFCVNVRGG